MISMMERVEYSDKDFECIRRVMYETSGISLSSAKRELVYSRLAKRVRQLGLDSFREYCSLLETDNAELGHCVNAMTTNVTSFFRENHHFEFLRQVVFSEKLAQDSRETINTVRIWCAGCSSGEEPYSVAMAAREFFGNHPLWRVEIDATDLDSNVLARANRGIYRDKDVHGMDPACLRRWFHKGTDGNEGRVRVVPEIRSMINFSVLNLKDNWQDRAPYDIIFCRNVMIYFDTEFKRRLIERFFSVLKPGGYLFVGHSESLFGLSNKFEIVGKTIHQKRRVARDAA